MLVPSFDCRHDAFRGATACSEQGTSHFIRYLLSHVRSECMAKPCPACWRNLVPPNAIREDYPDLISSNSDTYSCVSGSACSRAQSLEQRGRYCSMTLAPLLCQRLCRHCKRCGVIYTRDHCTFCASTVVDTSIHVTSSAAFTSEGRPTASLGCKRL